MQDFEILKAGDIAQLFGTTIDDFSPAVLAMIAACDFRFMRLSSSRQSEIRATICAQLDEGASGFARAGSQRQSRWQDGWAENLADFRASGHDLNALVPKYYDRPGAPARLFGEYIEPMSNLFELNLRRIFCRWLFEKYFGDVSSVHEFGCGSGMNIAMLALLYPDKKIFGYDWAKASRDIISVMREECGWNVEGGVFDMFTPHTYGDLAPGGALLAFHALEQIGGSFEAFLQYVLKQSFVRFVHVDGIEELYNPEVEMDALALRFCRARNYLTGYLTRLRELEDQGRIELVRVERVHFGNLYHDAYSYIVWRPL